MPNFPHQHSKWIDIHAWQGILQLFLLTQDFGTRPNRHGSITPEHICVLFQHKELNTIKLHADLRCVLLNRHKDIMGSQTTVGPLLVLQQMESIEYLRELHHYLQLGVSVQLLVRSSRVQMLIQWFLHFRQNIDCVLFIDVYSDRNAHILRHLQ